MVFILSDWSYTLHLYLIIVLLLLLYTQVFVRVLFLALCFSPCILSLCLPLLTHTLSYIIHLLSHLQRIQNYAARVILCLPMSSSITIHLKSLHWLPVKVRSTYKIPCLYYHCHSSTAQSHVADMLHRKPSHTHNTRSSPCTMPLLNRPADSKATLGDRSFSFASSVWNSIRNDVRCAPSLSSFMSRLKTFLFCSVYKDWTVSLITVHLCMAWPCHSFVDGISKKCINVHKKRRKKVKLINHDCLPILMLLYIMLYIMLAYLMFCAALCNAVCCIMLLFCHWFLRMLFVIMLCLGLLTHTLFISSMIFHHAQCF